MPLPNIPGSVLVPPKSSTTIFGINNPLKDIIVYRDNRDVNMVRIHIRMYVRTYRIMACVCICMYIPESYTYYITYTA